MSDDDSKKGKVLSFPTFVRMTMERTAADESFSRIGHYVLVGHVPVKAKNLAEWIAGVDERFTKASQFNVDPWQVAMTRIGDVDVSTVFIALDLNFLRRDGDQPLVFETMVFGGAHDGFQQRCSTWDDALEQHEEAVAMVRKMRVVK
jgi:hypothetical protein